ncbi:UNC93-like protein MFSD11 [Caenorhabditis elegans]|uniref:UNC93-like protein MFSD11 n=1 Tax=Caenorhabditis elegans TaxID=6239 RepID=Q8MYL9_CAEEL|nr:UNC93-like protein MFSD11 [Caenorhabditis elegans]CAD31837.2 UNC93-like protein MFSD11 [Caenorhabditis elegans]|eukprot:NP_741671.2 Uncharacterized protein CELE_Y39B6A.27 [Caenorhabditis elegans]
MKQRNFELLCSAMLGLGQLCIMVGYDSESFILESVIHSIHERTPEKVSPYAGYYGQAVTFASFMTACLFAPSILNLTTPKFLLVFAGISYALFPMGFLFFNTYFYYFSGALIGAGTAAFYLGMGSYLSAHSTRETIETNVSFSWSVSCFCLMIGAGILATITSLSTPPTVPQTANSTWQEEVRHERRYSDFEIKLLSAAFCGMASLGIVIFSFLPSKSVENSLESGEKPQKFGESFKLTCRTVISPKMMQILPLTILGGFNVSFWLSIFPTAMNFTKLNAHLTYIPAIYSLGAGLGEVLMGIVISMMSKRIKGFGLKPTMVLGALAVCIYCCLVHASTPFEAPMRPTSQPSLLISHSYPLIFIISFFCGMSDCCINSVRSVICALVMPSRRSQSFAVARMYHAFACTICFFFSPMVPLYFYTLGLPSLSIFAIFVFFRVVDNTHVMERKITEQKELNAAKLEKLRQIAEANKV